MVARLQHQPRSVPVAEIAGRGTLFPNQYLVMKNGSLIALAHTTGWRARSSRDRMKDQDLQARDREAYDETGVSSDRRVPASIERSIR